MLRLRLTRRRIDRQPLQAAHSAQFNTLLQSLAVPEAVTSGHARCKFCLTLIHTLDEVAAVFPDGGAVQLVCDKPACLLALADLVESRTDLM